MSAVFMRTRRALGAAGLAFVSALLFAGPSAAQVTPVGQNFELVRVASGLNLGVGFAFAPDGALYISDDNGGTVWRVVHGD